MKNRIIRLVTLLSLSLLFQTVLGQSLNWETQYDYNQAEDASWGVAVNVNGSIFCAGYSKTGSNYYYMMSKGYMNGDGVNLITYSTGSVNQAYDISLKGTYCYVTGRSKVGLYYKIATVRADTNLSGQVSITYHRTSTSKDYGQFVIPNSGSGDTIYVGGTSRITSPSDADAVLLKYASTGSGLSLVGSAALFDGFSSNTADTLKAMAVDANNNIYLTTKSYEGAIDGWDYYTVKYDRNLAEKWRTKYTSSGNTTDEPNAISVDAGGNVYVTGNSGSNAVTVKYNSSGVQQWVATYTNAIANDVATFNNAVYVTGSDLSHSPQYALTVKYDANGTQKWADSYVGVGCDYYVGYKIKIDTTGNAIFVGGGHVLVLFFKYDSSGNRAWVGSFRGPARSVDQLYDLAADRFGNLISVGYTRESPFGPSPDDQDFEVISYGVGAGFAPKASFVDPGLFSSKNDQSSNYSLAQNYPNPFNPATTIRYFLPEDGAVVMKIYDMLGREVKTVMDGQYILKGSHEVIFDASDLASGAYFYRILVDNGKYYEVKRMTLVK